MKCKYKLFSFIFLLFFIMFPSYSVYAADTHTYSLSANCNTQVEGSADVIPGVFNFEFYSDSPVYIFSYKAGDGIHYIAASLSNFNKNVDGWNTSQSGFYYYNCNTVAKLNSDNKAVYYYVQSFAAYYYIDDGYTWYDVVSSFLKSGSSDGLTEITSEGTIDNPILDENIGTLILDKTIMYEESNGNDINDLYNLWSWKNKTSTGYSLSDNDYAQTFIQVKVESKCVIYSDLRHTKVKQNFDNYGEKGMLFNQIPVNNQPLKVSYLTDVPKALPLTHAESHNPLYVGYNYTLYFRVVCTNSTQVIPDDSSSEWHCGGWRAMDCNADVLNSQSDKSSNGHFDDDDNWIADEDDGNNDVTAGSDSVHDTDDAKDSFANYQPSSGMSTDTAIGNLKDLMNMVGYIPTMIATLFSFLPSWCITLISVTFVSMLVLIVYKLIRG